MKTFSLGRAHNGDAAQPEEVVALRRLSQTRDDGIASMSDFSDSDDYDEYAGENYDGPAIDGGREAWKILLAAWVIDFMTAGVLVTFGLFQTTYTSDPLFAPSSASIPTIGTLMSGISWLFTPLANALVLRYSAYKIRMQYIGWGLCILGLFLASFATQVWHLQLFQGVMYGAGWVVYWSPLLVLINEWWVERRGLAYGIWFTASNGSGLVMPFIIQHLLDRYGFRITLRLYAFLSILIAGPATLLLRPRLPVQRHRFPSLHKMEETKSLIPLLLPTHLWKNTHFHLFTLAIFFQSFVYIVPFLYLPSFASSLSLPSTSGSQLLALSAISTTLGQVVFGSLSDRLHPYILSSVSSLISSITAFFVQKVTGFAGLAGFAFFWSFFAGSYDVLYARICAVLTEGDADSSLILYGFLSFERGVAVLVEGYIVPSLVKDEIDGFEKYGSLLALCGWCMLGSAICGVGWFRRGNGG